MTRLLTQFGGGVAKTIHRSFPEVEIVELPAVGAAGEGSTIPLDPGLTGDVLLASHRSAGVGSLARRVRWVHLFGTGVDGLAPEVHEHAVVTCSRGAGAVPISEFVLGGMLAFEKDLPATWLSEPPSHWGWARLGGLDGRTLGLVGLGGIGAAIAVRAQAFGMKVVATRRRPLPSPVQGVRLAESLEEVLRSADHLVLAAPATARTRHLIDREALALVRPGLHLVNIARGSLVDQDALRVALDGATVAMATLDVVEPEPLPAGHWLFSHPRVRLSAHVSGSSPAMVDRIVELFCDNLRRFLAGQPLADVVDPSEGY
ncbi:MAG: NAD(P)-dependent oxidoreductase [Acidimicrobiales bacterium]